MFFILLSGLLTSACAAPERANATIEFVITAPRADGPVYVTGNLQSLGPWKADAMQLAEDDNVYKASIEVPIGAELEYKITLGSWDREALGPSGMVMPNSQLSVTQDKTIKLTISDFKKPVSDYIEDWRGSGVSGELVYWTGVESKFLEPDRHVSIWLPSAYAEYPERSFDVLYMSDGQNLFDPRIANTGVDWGVDEAIDHLVEQDIIEPVIVVGVWSTARRGNEYSPWHDGPDYARFLIEELVPRVNSQFRTNEGPAHTYHAGSSMGGLISYYLVTRHPDVFGACGCISTHTPLSPAIANQYFEVDDTSDAPSTKPYIVDDLEAGIRAPRAVRFWFDYGTKGLDAGYAPQHDIIRTWLLDEGLEENTDFIVREYKDADHNETSWRERLPDVLAFVLAKEEI